MKKIIFLFTIVIISLSSFAQIDSTKSKVEFNPMLTIMSRNYSRGANFGDGVSIQPNVEISYKKVTFGILAALTDNKKYNYGTTFVSYLSCKVKRFTFGVHDFYFANKVDSLNDFFFQTRKEYMYDSTKYYKDGHYLEFQVKYNTKKFYLLASYNFYNTTCDIYESTIYLESKYMLTDNFGVAFGFTSGASAVNFYGDKYNNGVGVTCIGLDWLKRLKFQKVYFQN